MRAIDIYTGQEITEPDPPPSDDPPAEGAIYDVEVFDRLPRWARDALREIPKYDVKAREVAPHVVTGVVHPGNIRPQLLANDQRWREHFAEKDRADGLA